MAKPINTASNWAAILAAWTALTTGGHAKKSQAMKDASVKYCTELRAGAIESEWDHLPAVPR